ncbi:hypothetical protein [Aeriscardovia aeriphila]|uniref:XRE family transcriptional regulator n=1 Tax=Aeriscardovia aeriphila TaxID=218139 RepID=A0A261FC43_9BIFI|nr:hypothetical protein [Aeriscardovia aeriphila]NYI25303.1 hypothetical protein [Aeriscardovia aeriphila]OZG56543.1 hypothetical protein AEAE_1031 [Aeriscardovia aeriphila]
MARNNSYQVFRDWLSEQGISPVQAAHLCELPSHIFVNKLEGKRQWNARDLQIIYRTFGISADFVLGLWPDLDLDVHALTKKKKPVKA